MVEISFIELIKPSVYNPHDREISDEQVREWIDERLQASYQLDSLVEGSILFEVELIGGKDSYFASTRVDYRSFDPTDFVGKTADELAEMFP